MFIRYLAARFQAEVRYILDGGPAGSNISDIAEQITITNLGDTTLDITFFQYNDFDLGGDSSDDTAFLVNANAIQQHDDAFHATEVVITPNFSRWETSGFPTLLIELSDDDIDDLSNTTTPFGPGDAVFAFQWNFAIAPGAAMQISKAKNLTAAAVLEPGTLGLLGAGLAMLGLAFRRRSVA